MAETFATMLSLEAKAKIKIILGFFFFLFSLQTFAFQVTVKSSSKEVSGIGFSVDGKNHGGMGKSYTKANMPAGSYAFGIRVDGLFGTDVGCKTPKGKKYIALKNDTVAIVKYQKNVCIVQIYSN